MMIGETNLSWINCMDMSVDTSKVTTPELRKFGLMFGAIIIALFGLLIPWIADAPILVTGKAFTLGAVFIVWGLILPATLKPVYSLWMKFGGVAGYINTHIIMVLLFALIITPIGLIMRLFNDPMRRSLTDDSKSYRVLREQDKPKTHMEKPF
ncbi:MAG: hypothetical protein ACJAQS_001465 [Porticoccus sp.]|jgi:hypothetical protein